MSLILCRPESVKHPYYAEPLGVHLFSSQELCYVIYQYPLLLMEEVLGDSMLSFIREELKQVFLAEKLTACKKNGENPDELLILILEESSSYRAAELQTFRQKLLSYRKLGKAEQIKERADLYASLRQYRAAIRDYEAILENWRLQSLSNEFTSAVWNNMGAAYAGMFWFEKAMTAYDMSYKLLKKEETLKRMYQLTLFCPKLSLRERYQAGIGEEKKARWTKEFEEALKQGEQTEAMEELSRLFACGEEKRESGTGTLLGRWKKEYRRMLQG